jgi:dTDP-glucose 4,6-dehydratase
MPANTALDTAPASGLPAWTLRSLVALLAILEKGRDGEIYNICGNRSVPNRWVNEQILEITGKPASLMTTVTDRPGHDRPYALSSGKLSKETGWIHQMDFESGLKATVEWYRANGKWVRDVKSGEYQSYYAKNGDHRASELNQVRA